MESEEVKVTARSNPSQRIIALGIVFAFLYFASNIIIALLTAVLIAYFLDPVVGLLERIHIPRALGSLLVILAGMAILGGVVYLMVDRTEQFGNDWPRYSAKFRHVVAELDRRLSTVQKQVDAINPSQGKNRQPPKSIELPPVRDWLFQGVGSLYSILLVGTFVPFLVFFMLASKPRIWHATLELFPNDHRERVKAALDQVGAVLRSFVAGNALVALILVLSSWAFFLAIHLEYPFLAGCVAGLFNLVPYFGVLLALILPLFIGMTQWSTPGPFLGMAAMMVALHLVTQNVLMPAIVGRRVHLNALAVTIALLFWGWLWGGIGLILAIPVTATIKVICDHVDGCQSTGRWLGE